MPPSDEIDGETFFSPEPQHSPEDMPEGAATGLQEQLNELRVRLEEVENERDSYGTELKNVMADRESLSFRCRSLENTVEKLINDNMAKDKQIKDLQDLVRAQKPAERSIFQKKTEETKEMLESTRSSMSLRRFEDSFFAMFDDQ